MSENILLLTERVLPDGLSLARTTPSFTLNNVPPAILNQHETSVWGKLVVEKGSLIFTEYPNESHAEDIDRLLSIGEEQVIVPHFLHRVKPEADAQFRIEFYK